MRVYITGGAGYIGSHLARAISATGRDVVIIDTASKSNEFPTFNLDISDELSVLKLQDLFASGSIHDSVIHLAAKKSVGESVLNPELYKKNNVGGTANLLKAMKISGVKRLIFASTAAVYGDLAPVVSENSFSNPISPYAATKLEEENLIQLAQKDWGLNFLIARYFNVSGAGWPDLIEKSGENLFPRIINAAEHKTKFEIFGRDYATPDGTAIRDYIHVLDLVDAHLLALDALQVENLGILNFGTSHGSSVKEVVTEFRKYLDFAVEYGPRRVGDIPSLLSDNSLAKKCLGWQSVRTLEDMVRSVI